MSHEDWNDPTTVIIDSLMSGKFSCQQIAINGSRNRAMQSSLNMGKAQMTRLKHSCLK